MVMCHTRSKYHRAVKLAKREAGNARASDMRTAAEAGDVEFLKEMKKSFGKKNNGGQQVPDSFEGKVTKDTILDKFRECYENLYNSAGTEDAMAKIKEEFGALIGEQSGAD